jgi:biopolymer transport protein ExbB
MLVFASVVMGVGSPAVAAEEPRAMGLWPLFAQSFDVFTVLLLLGSVTGLTVVFIAMIEVRKGRILPEGSTKRLQELVYSSRWEELRFFVQRDESYVSRVLRQPLHHLNQDRGTMRESAELAASEETARWFRKIELLNVIGNLGPLIGLAGTVWGMILAFSSLGQAGGDSQAADLSVGISKALFHTLLGLCLAIPCLFVFGVYRGVVDRLCTRGMVMVSEVVERLPARESGAGAPAPHA